MLTSNRTPLLLAAGVLTVLLAGCGSADKSAPSPKQISVAMDAQPRIVETQTGSSIKRIVVDTKAGYQALISPSGQLVDMVKGRIEYRRIPGHGCYGRFRARPVSTYDVWEGMVSEAIDSGYRVTVSGNTVVYRGKGVGSGSSVTVDDGTKLIRSTTDFPSRSTGVPDSTGKLSYPKSVAELPIPTNICDKAAAPLSPAAYERLPKGESPHHGAAR